MNNFSFGINPTNIFPNDFMTFLDQQDNDSNSQDSEDNSSTSSDLELESNLFKPDDDDLDVESDQQFSQISRSLQKEYYNLMEKMSELSQAQQSMVNPYFPYLYFNSNFQQPIESSNTASSTPNNSQLNENANQEPNQSTMQSFNYPSAVFNPYYCTMFQQMNPQLAMMPNPASNQTFVSDQMQHQMYQPCYFQSMMDNQFRKTTSTTENQPNPGTTSNCSNQMAQNMQQMYQPYIYQSMIGNQFGQTAENSPNNQGTISNQTSNDTSNLYQMQQQMYQPYYYYQAMMGSQFGQTINTTGNQVPIISNPMAQNMMPYFYYQSMMGNQLAQTTESTVNGNETTSNQTPFGTNDTQLESQKPTQDNDFVELEYINEQTGTRIILPDSLSQKLTTNFNNQSNTTEISYINDPSNGRPIIQLSTNNAGKPHGEINFGNQSMKFSTQIPSIDVKTNQTQSSTQSHSGPITIQFATVGNRQTVIQPDDNPKQLIKKELPPKPEEIEFSLPSQLNSAINDNSYRSTNFITDNSQKINIHFKATGNRQPVVQLDDKTKQLIHKELPPKPEEIEFSLPSQSTGTIKDNSYRSTNLITDNSQKINIQFKAVGNKQPVVQLDDKTKQLIQKELSPQPEEMEFNMPSIFQYNDQSEQHLKAEFAYKKAENAFFSSTTSTNDKVSNPDQVVVNFALNANKQPIIQLDETTQQLIKKELPHKEEEIELTLPLQTIDMNKENSQQASIDYKESKPKKTETQIEEEEKERNSSAKSIDVDSDQVTIEFTLDKNGQTIIELDDKGQQLTKKELPLNQEQIELEMPSINFMNEPSLIDKDSHINQDQSPMGFDKKTQSSHPPKFDIKLLSADIQHSNASPDIKQDNESKSLENSDDSANQHSTSSQMKENQLNHSKVDDQSDKKSTDSYSNKEESAIESNDQVLLEFNKPKLHQPPKFDVGKLIGTPLKQNLPATETKSTDSSSNEEESAIESNDQVLPEVTKPKLHQPPKFDVGNLAPNTANKKQADSDSNDAILAQINRPQPSKTDGVAISGTLKKQNPHSTVIMPLTISGMNSTTKPSSMAFSVDKQSTKKELKFVKFLLDGKKQYIELDGIGCKESIKYDDASSITYEFHVNDNNQTKSYRHGTQHNNAVESSQCFPIRLRLSNVFPVDFATNGKVRKTPETNEELIAFEQSVRDYLQEKNCVIEYYNSLLGDLVFIVTALSQFPIEIPEL